MTAGRQGNRAAWQQNGIDRGDDDGPPCWLHPDDVPGLAGLQLKTERDIFKKYHALFCLVPV